MAEWILLCVAASFIIGGVLYHEERKSMGKRMTYVKEMAACLVVCTALGATGVTYQAGRYIARQCEIKLGFTKMQYEANQLEYRAALTGLVFIGGGTGVVAALAFDDYYVGI